MADDDKPAFDPSQPFQAADEKPAFDPNKPFEAASSTQKQPASWTDTALDVAKQIPSGIASGIEAIPGTVPTVMRALGKGVDWGLEKAGLQTPEMAEEAKRLSDIGEYSDKNRWSINNALPEPQTTAGQYARTAGEFLPAAAIGPGSLARRVVTQDVAPAIASEAAGQATAGTELEPYARVGAAVAGGFPFGRWRTAEARAASPAPLADELYDSGRDKYRQIREGDFALKTKPVGDLADNIEQHLTQMGLTERNVPETYGVIRDLQDLKTAKPVIDPVTNQPVQPKVTATDLDTARQELLQATRNQTNLRESKAGWEAINKLDKYLSDVPQAHVVSGDAKATSELFNSARGDWAAAKRLEMVQGKVDLGQLNAETAHSGMNQDNSMRQAIKQLIRPNKYGKTLAEQHGFSPEEQGLMNDVAKGTMTRNTLRYVSGLLGGGGGLGQAAIGLAGAGLGYETGRPEFYALGALGYGTRKIAGHLAVKDANKILSAVGRRSPLGGGPLPTVPGQSKELLGAGALRGVTGDLTRQPAAGIPALQGPGAARANEDEVVGPPGQQKYGGAVEAEQGFAQGGSVDCAVRNPKHTKAQADYKAGTKVKECSQCCKFVEPRGCKGVAGSISPHGVCKYFVREDNKFAQGGPVLPSMRVPDNHPILRHARQAPDGHHYVPDPRRTGKFMRIMPGNLSA